MKPSLALFGALVLLALPQALAQPVIPRPYEAADDSLRRDDAAITALLAQAEAMDAAGLRVMGAPGARFTAPYRLAAARALGDSAKAIRSQALRLRDADADLARALDARASARRDVAQAVATAAELARTGIVAQLDRTPDPSAGLLSAKADAARAADIATAWADALLAPDTLRAEIVLDTPLPPGNEASLTHALSGLWPEVAESLAIAVASDSIVLTHDIARETRLADITPQIEARFASVLATLPGAPGIRFILVTREPAPAPQ